MQMHAFLHLWNASREERLVQFFFLLVVDGRPEWDQGFVCGKRKDGE